MKELFNKLFGRKGAVETSVDEIITWGKTIANGALATFDVLATELEEAASHFEAAKQVSETNIAKLTEQITGEIARLQNQLTEAQNQHDTHVTEAAAAAAQATKAAGNIRALVA